MSFWGKLKELKDFDNSIQKKKAEETELSLQIKKNQDLLDTLKKEIETLFTY